MIGQLRIRDHLDAGERRVIATMRNATRVFMRMKAIYTSEEMSSQQRRLHYSQPKQNGEAAAAAADHYHN